MLKTKKNVFQIGHLTDTYRTWDTPSVSGLHSNYAV